MVAFRGRPGKKVLRRIHYAFVTMPGAPQLNSISRGFSSAVKKLSQKNNNERDRGGGGTDRT